MQTVKGTCIAVSQSSVTFVCYRNHPLDNQNPNWIMKFTSIQ